MHNYIIYIHIYQDYYIYDEYYNYTLMTTELPDDDEQHYNNNRHITTIASNYTAISSHTKMLEKVQTRTFMQDSLTNSHCGKNCSFSSVDFSVAYMRGLKVTKTPSLALMVTPCTSSKGTLVSEDCSIV